MRPVRLLPDGWLSVPHADLDPAAGGIAHTDYRIGPDDPEYDRLRKLAVPQDTAPGSSRQAEVGHFLLTHQDEGDAMLRRLRRQVDRQDGQRRAS